MSISLTATVDTARLCAKDNRTVPVTVLDSRQLSLGTGLLVLKAAPLADGGAGGRRGGMSVDMFGLARRLGWVRRCFFVARALAYSRAVPSLSFPSTEKTSAR